ncbi:MAG: hypothetical protein HPY79_06540 [Bacteroidales bacterium]|nr:hypothetical protein [Bacteroidales bacterium]
MKLFVIIVLLWLIHCTLQAQDKVFISYINRTEYKKLAFRRDSIVNEANEIKHYQEYVMQKIPFFLQLDSITKNNNEIAFYWSKPIEQKLYFQLLDTQKKFIEKKSWNKHAAVLLKKRLDNHLKILENNGFPFAEITLDTLYILDKNKLFLSYCIAFNQRITFDSLDVIGKPILSKSFLSAYTGIIPNSTYQEKKIKNVNHLINELPFVQTTHSPDLFFINQKAKLRIYLAKKNANSFSGLLGVGNGDNNKVKVTGNLTIALKNIFKHADDLNVMWKTIGTKSQQLDFSFSYPYILHLPVGFTGKLHIYKQDSSYVNTQYKIGIMFYTHGFNGILAYYEQKQSSIYQIQSINNPNITSLNGIYGGVKAVFSQQNEQLLPTQGYYFTIDAAYGNRTIFKSPSMSDSVYNSIHKNAEQWKVYLYSVKIFPLFNPFFLKIKLDAGYLSKAQFKNELYRLGGSQSLRGFDEESLFAYSYFLPSAEWRWILDKNTQIFAFYDQLFYKSIQQHDNPWGLGVGTEINTSAGLFFISYALGSQNNEPIIFRNAKIHFGYKNKF